MLIASAMGACSADIARFDSPSFSLNAKADAPLPRPTEPLRGRDTSYLGGEGQNFGGGGQPQPESGVQRAALPEPSQLLSTPLSPRRSPRPALHAASTAPAPGPRVVGGETIDVAAGDTLYGLSRRYHVSLADLMTLNALQSPTLRPGQKLVLPHNARRPLARPAVVAAAPSAAQYPPGPAAAIAPAEPAVAPVAVAFPAGDWSGSYTVRAGDSLYALSHRAKVKLADLEAANGIVDARKIRPGVVLKVPAGVNMEPPVPRAPVVAEAAAVIPVAAAPPAVAAAVPVATTLTRPTIINQRVASLGDSIPDSPAVAARESKVEAPVAPKAAPRHEQTAVVLPAGGGAAGTGKLRWPVRGKVIGQFGTRPDGTHNDGINVAVPLGTEIHAADNGVVAYAGNELKGYGNLVLVRHDNGWVTAYAHNDEILVKRGDKVHRGQIVAKAGRTGEVDQPQLHFELRQGSKPVDPTPFLDQL